MGFINKTYMSYIAHRNFKDWYDKNRKIWVHKGYNDIIMDCGPKSFHYINQLEGMIRNILKHLEESEDFINKQIEFYKESQIEKDDFASELHILTSELVRLDKMREIVLEGIR